MNELFTYLFDENVLKNKLREKWIKLYDFNFVDKDIIGGLLTTKKILAIYSHLYITKPPLVIFQLTKKKRKKKKRQPSIPLP